MKRCNFKKDEEKEFKVEDDCFKQGKTPICAIYSFLNGLFYDKEIYEDDIKAAAKELWEYALNPNDKILAGIDSTDLKYSLVGEFFDSKELCDFLNDVWANHEIFEKFNKLLSKTNLKNISASIINEDEDKSVNLENCNFNKKLSDRSIDNYFYIVPIDADTSCKNNMHWVCIRNKEILNSSDKKFLRRAIRNYLCTNPSSNETVRNCLYTNSYNKEAVIGMFLGIHNRNKHLKFEFYKWAKKKKGRGSKEYICECKERIDRILELKKCNYYFCKSNFNVIRVELGNGE